MIATGMAISSGHGVATTSTLRNRIGIAVDHHASAGDRQRERRVPGAELIADAAEARAPLLGVLHHLHDLRVPRVGREPGRADAQERSRR